MKRPLLAILTVLLALAPASPASAARLSDDCQDGKIDGTYTQAQFQRALRNLATDVDEYSDCRAVIRRAQLAAAGRRSGGGGGDSDSGGAPGAGSPTTTGGGGAGGATSGSGVTGDPNDTVRDDPLADTTARERHALQEATAGGGTPVAMSGGPVRPGVRRDGATHDLPGPLLALLVLLAVALAGGGATVIRSRVLARRAG